MNSEELSSQLGDLQSMTPEALSSFKDGIKKDFESLKDSERTNETVTQMTELANAMSVVREEETRREAEKLQLEELAQNAISVIDEDSDSDDDSTEDPEVESEAQTEDEKEEEDEVSEEFSEDVETLSADTAELANDSAEEVEVIEDDEAPAEELASNTEATEDEAPAPIEEEVADSEFSNETKTESEEVATPVNSEFSAPDMSDSTPAPEQEATRKVATIVAAADVRGLTAGSVIPTKKALAEAILDRRKAMSRTSGGDGEQALVASFKTDDFYGEERTLDSADATANASKIEAVIASLKASATAGEALVAAGGLYGPVDTSFDIYELGETVGRPVKDSLPSFKADRGGLRFIEPPVLTDLDGAVSIWTIEDDEAAVNNDGSSTDKTKPCIRVKAGETTEVFLEAVPLCLTFGNMGARAFPELVERHINLAMVWHSRFAEQHLLNKIAAGSTKVTAVHQLGAARDILVQIDQVTAALRNRHRLDPEAPLRAIFPHWFKNALRADLVKQIPGDGLDSTLSLAEATITALFAERNISVTWSLDGEDATQYFAAQADGAMVDFPSDVVWYVFPEGTWLFLEGGTLDLGIVRDSTLNATNDYKLFVEDFENVAKVGVESLRIKSAVRILGSSSATTDISDVKSVTDAP